MKRFEPYTSIRRKALIYGLPVPSFALMMLCVIGSLLGIIFSFSLAIIVLALAINTALYICLLRITHSSGQLNFRKVYPALISNKNLSGLHYED